MIRLKLFLVLLKDFIKDYKFFLLALLNAIFLFTEINGVIIIFINIFAYTILEITNRIHIHNTGEENINLKDLQFGYKFTKINKEGYIEMVDESQIYEMVKYVNFIEGFIEGHGHPYLDKKLLK